MRRNKLTTQSALPKKSVIQGTRWLECRECGKHGGECAFDIGAFTCAYCVAKMVAPPEQPKALQNKPEEKRPRGWHLMAEYVSPSGKVYHRGKEVDDVPRHAVPVVQPKEADSARKPKRRVSRTIRASKSEPTKPTRKRGRPRKKH